MTYKKKLIEVALPLEAINKESAREKSIRHGHPSTLHPWWARRPLAACRAVIFASLVDDPSAHPDRFPTDEAQESERQRLFRIIEALVKWENLNNEAILTAARREIERSTDGDPPPVLDPFCGGGSIPLEAQRLGLKAYASDLNPVAVLITKALVEIPPKFAGNPPVNPNARAKMGTDVYRGAQGLADDVRYYGEWMRDEAERRIGHLYRKVKLPASAGGGEATVIAWLWARTVKCPNPACGARMPLVRSFWLSSKKGKKAWIEPIIDKRAKTVEFEVRTGEGQPSEPPKIGRGAKFKCIVCGEAAEDDHIKAEGMAGRMDAKLMAIVAEGSRGRVYLPPDPGHEKVARTAKPQWGPEEELPYEPRAIWCTLYGLKKFRDLFTPRQLMTLTTFSDLVSEARDQVLKDAVAAGVPDEGGSLAEGGNGAAAYADAVATLLGISISKLTVFHNTLARWRAGEGKSAPAFGRQALPMVWDYAEVNPFAGAGGDWLGVIKGTSSAVTNTAFKGEGTVRQLDSLSGTEGVVGPLVCTDPPYYDNIGYADLSDFFYVWLRKTMSGMNPDLFSTLLTPKEQELIASPYRSGGKEEAQRFFERGLARFFESMRVANIADPPMTLFYAFKQTETEEPSMAGAAASTGWESMLEGLLKTGWSITATWPMRTEGSTRLIAAATNSLASSIVLACRPRTTNAPLATKQEFVTALKRELPGAVKKLQHGNIAPVDLAQASIGPGMAIFSRYAKVVEADGSSMRVRTALEIINQVLGEVLTEQEDQYDSATRWAVGWFEQFGMKEGAFGQADVLARAKGTAVNALTEDGLVQAKAGKVRLLRRGELPEDWDPRTDSRLRVWEVTQHLVRALERDGEEAAAEIVRKGPFHAEIARDLAYRLYTTCERKKWPQEALAYNALVVAWPEIQQLAGREPTEIQGQLIE